MLALPKVSTDLLLVHAPAFFDFRHRRDIYFPYLSTSGDVPITPLYEYFPLGFKTLQRYLLDRGHGVRILNLSTVLLRHPQLNVQSLFENIEAKLIGIDLHWMIHVQGALAVAELVKRVNPTVPVILGGISSTYYASELIQYPFVDMVMKGYDTHAPMDTLLQELKGRRRLARVPNLLWKSPTGGAVDNGLTHTPDHFSCGVDWSQLPRRNRPALLPVLELLSTQNAGCAYNCGWCGGSREAFRRVFGRKKAMARKTLKEVEWEFSRARLLPDRDRYLFYSIGSYNEPQQRMLHFIDQVGQTGLKSVSYEQYHLTPDDVLRAMAAACPKTSITLSPESNDPRIAKLAGRGVYSMEQMENWIERALDLGIFQVDVWFFIGMPEQTEAAVWDNVRYCEHLLRKFKGKRVVPLLCPMIPFLDPASTFFTYPEQHGYKTFFRTVEEHRRGMQRASLINRMNYETRWLSRTELVDVGYRAVRRLFELKGEYGQLPSSMASEPTRRIDDALGLIKLVHAADCLRDEADRARELEQLGDEILKRNQEIFFGGISNQAFPLARQIGGRWFDEDLDLGAPVNADKPASA